MGQEAGGRPASFGEFGAAMVADVITPEFLRQQLDGALRALLRRTDWLPEFAADIAKAWSGTPRLLADDGSERSFAVTLNAKVETGVGPRLLAVGVSTQVEIDLTVRVHAFRPAVLQLDIDPVTPDDVRLRGRARSDWFPLPLSGLPDLADRSLPVLSATLNRALGATVEQRRVDVLERVRSWRGGFAGSTEPREGPIGAGERVEWSIELAEQERVALQLWAALEPEPGTAAADTSDASGTSGTSGADGPAGESPVSLEISLLDPDGEPVDELSLTVRRTAPDFDTTATGPGISATAAAPGGYRARLTNPTSAPVRYRIEEDHTTVPGRRVDFAEFGRVLIEHGIDRVMVLDTVNHQLTQSLRASLDTSAMIQSNFTARLTDVQPEPAPADRLHFRLALVIEIEVRVGPGANATVVGSTLQADVALRVHATVEPAALVMDFTPLADRDLRVAAPPRRIGGRRIPIPERTLAGLAPARIAGELNRKLAEAGRRIVAADLAAAQSLGFAHTTTAMLRQTSFTGVAHAGRPQTHTVLLATQQRIRAKARIFVRSDSSGGPGTDVSDLPDVVAELTLCDERGGVRAADQKPVPGEGPVILGVEFTAPDEGQWRLRVDSIGRPADLDYELVVLPEG